MRELVGKFHPNAALAAGPASGFAAIATWIALGIATALAAKLAIDIQSGAGNFRPLLSLQKP